MGARPDWAGSGGFEVGASLNVEQPTNTGPGLLEPGPSLSSAPPESGSVPRGRVVFILVLLSVLAWRFVQVRDLVLPPWVDSVHHTLLVRLLLEHGGLPDTWAPYLPAVPFYYHFGFHLSTALLAWVSGLTGLDLGRAVLVAGQLWQVALAWGIHRLADALLESPRKALTALVLVGFVSPMPAHYTSWGRYTLLAGLTLMVFGMVAALRGRLTAVAILVAATAVTHYYAFCLLVLFLAFVVVLRHGPRPGLHLGLAAATGIAVAAPWLVHVWSWSRALARAAAPGGPSGGSDPGAPLARLLGPERNYILLALAVVGLLRLARGWSRRDPRARSAACFGVWTLALASLLGPWQIGPFRPDHAAIVLFIPATVLAADSLCELAGPRFTWAGVCLLTAWGLAESRQLVRPHLVLARAADLEAIHWIDAHTDPRAAVLLDAQPWMGLWRGVDGGWWITPLTGRPTVPPPVAYSWGPPELASVLRATGSRAGELSRLPFPEVCASAERLMEETGARFYYTWSPRVRRCTNLRAAFEIRDGPAVLALRADGRGGAGGFPQLR